MREIMERLRFESELADLGIVAERENGGSASQSQIVRICLIDPAGVFKDSKKLRQDFMTKLEAKFNNLDAKWLKSAGLEFKVLYLSSEPSDKAKSEFKKLDFPIYLLAAQHRSKTVLEIMKQHKIPQKIGKTDIYDYAKDAWDQKYNRGLGIPSYKAFRKVGFIKTQKVFDDAPGDFDLAFVNVTAHEIGHMGNRLSHSKKGIMKYPVPLTTEIDFDQSDKYSFLSDLMRLKNLKKNES
jgi:hypothetical protein